MFMLTNIPLNILNLHFLICFKSYSKEYPAILKLNKLKKIYLHIDKKKYSYSINYG